MHMYVYLRVIYQDWHRDYIIEQTLQSQQDADYWDDDEEVEILCVRECVCVCLCV